MKLEDFGVERQETILSNGVKLILFNRKGMPVNIRVSFLAGSRFDQIGKEGSAHFLEHMLVAGTKNFPTNPLPPVTSTLLFLKFPIKLFII